MTNRRWLLVTTACAVAAVAAAACGSGKKNHAGVTTFVVTRFDTGAPVPGVAIVLADSAGNPMSTVTTDSSGTATLHVAAGRTATVYWADGSALHEADTYFGVTDGEVVSDPLFLSSTTTTSALGSYQLTWHGAPAGTVRYGVQLDCQGFLTAQTSSTLSGVSCGGDSPSNVFVFALDATNHRLGWGAAFDLPATGGTGTATADIDVSNTGFSSLTIGHGSLGSFGPTSASAQLPVYLDTAGASVSIFGFATLSTSSGPVTGPTGRVPQIPGAIAVPEVVLLGAVYTSGYQYVRSGKGFLATSVPSSFSPDMSALAIPDLPSVDLSDPLAPAVSWTRSGSDEGQEGYVEIDWNDQVIRFAQFPPGMAPAVRFPRLPAGFSAWATTGSPLVFAGYSGSDAWTDYAASLAAPYPPRTASFFGGSVIRY